MRYIRYLFLFTLGVVLLVVALANRNLVTLTVLPEELAAFAGWSPTLTLPLFLVIFGGIVAGVAIGFVWEWLREHKYRAEATTERRERVRLEHEVRRLRPEGNEPGDDVLALLEKRKAAS